MGPLVGCIVKFVLVGGSHAMHRVKLLTFDVQEYLVEVNLSVQFQYKI